MEYGLLEKEGYTQVTVVKIRSASDEPLLMAEPATDVATPTVGNDNVRALH